MRLRLEQRYRRHPSPTHFVIALGALRLGGERLMTGEFNLVQVKEAWDESLELACCLRRSMLVACINENECESEHVNNFSSLTWTYFLCPRRNVGIPDHCHRRRWSHLRKQRQDRLQHSPRAAFLHRRPQNRYAKTSLSTNNLFYGHFEMPSTVEGCSWIFSDCSCELVRSHQWVSHSAIIGCRKHRYIFPVKQLSGSQRNSQFIALHYVDNNWWVLTLLRGFYTCCFHLWSDVVFHMLFSSETEEKASPECVFLSQRLQSGIERIYLDLYTLPNGARTQASALKFQ